MIKGKYPTEQMEQIAFSDWLTWNRIEFFHIPNGGKRNIIESVKFKKMGVKSGVPDIFICEPRFPYHGLFIEMKNQGGGKISENQKRFMLILSDLGFMTRYANGCEDAIKIVEEYFSMETWDRYIVIIKSLYRSLFSFIKI